MNNPKCDAIKDRNASEELCATKEAQRIASEIAGYTVDQSTLNQAVASGSVFGATIANVMWYQIKSLKKYAEHLRDVSSRNLRSKADEIFKIITAAPAPVQKMIFNKMKEVK